MKELDVVNLNSGDILFHEGDPGEHLYVVVEGELEILLAPDTDDELILNTASRGGISGGNESPPAGRTPHGERPGARECRFAKHES